MPNVTYKPLSSLSPIQLKYDYSREEELNTKTFCFREGLAVNTIEGLNVFQDVSINRNTCLALTNTTYLSSIFKTPDLNNTINRYPTTIKLSRRNDSSKFISFDSGKNILKSDENNPSTFYLSPVSNTKQVEIFIEGKYVQVKQNYPFDVYLQEDTLDPEEIERQRFFINYQDNFISFKTLTTSGYRYLCLTSDNILRAVGCVLNNVVVNDYIFNCISVTDNNASLGFLPTNNWVSYYHDTQIIENKTVNINKDKSDILTNFLLDFPVEKTVTEGACYINVANLKTHVTPQGHPTSLI
jgi:hypothetical protein